MSSHASHRKPEQPLVVRRCSGFSSSPAALLLLVLLCAMISAAGAAWAAATSCGVDLDKDGLDDGFEQQLIDYYRPWYYFDSRQHNSDDKWPSSVTWYISRCSLRYYDGPQEGASSQVVYTAAQLAANPLLVLQGGNGVRPSSNRADAGADAKSTYRLDLPDGPGIGEGPNAHTGTYARVDLAGTTDSPEILVQYMQFYPYNDFQDAPGAGDHEADWTFLEVYLQPRAPFGVLRYVFHHHGDSNCAATTVSGSYFAQSYGDSIPRCYIEEDEHEWWPFPGDNECSFAIWDNASHDGQGVRYRSENVRNIGEYGNPMPDPESQIIVNYNGRWGNTLESISIVGFDVYQWESPHGPPFQHAFGGPTCLSTPLNWPADGTQCTSVTPALRWSANPLASGYRVQVSTNPAFGASVVVDQLLCGAVTSTTVPGLAPERTYFWRVLTQPETCGGSNSSPTREFTTGPVPPLATTLLAPASGAAEPGDDVMLRWKSVAGASSYRVTLRCSGGDTVVDTLVPGLSLASVLAPAAYAWSVSAISTAGACSATGPASPTWSFTVGSGVPLPSPVLLTPLDGSACQPASGTLRWQPTAGATGYYVRLERHRCDARGEYHVSEPHFEFSNIQVAPDWTWSVRDDRPCSSYSECRTFAVVDSARRPHEPKLSSPEDFATEQPLSGRLVWERIPEAASYRVRLGGSCDSVRTWDVDTTFFDYSGLAEGSSYAWSVSAINECGVLSDLRFCRTFTTERLSGIDRVFLPSGLTFPPGATGITIPVLAENLTGLRRVSVEVKFDPRILTYKGASVNGTRGVDGRTRIHGDGRNGLISVDIDYPAGTTCAQALEAGVGPVLLLGFDVAASASQGATTVSFHQATFVPCSETSIAPRRFDQAISIRGTTGVDPRADLAFALERPQPNPTSGPARLTFALPEYSDADVSVFDIAGKRVATLAHGPFPAGRHSVTWNSSDRDGRRVANGIYFVRLSGGGRVAATRVIVAR